MKKQKHTSPVKGSTQNFIEIEALDDDVLLLKDHSCCVIIAPGTTNFGLLSEEEQRSMIYSYASLLNSLSFPVQIVILSKKMDISSYLDYVDEKIKQQSNQEIRQKLLNYKEFIKNIITKNTILEKNFFFVVPFSALEMGITKSSKKKISKEYIFTRAKTSLYPKRDHMIRLLKKAGLGGRVLHEQEIIELFYNIYNPVSGGRKLAPIQSYTDIVMAS